MILSKKILKKVKINCKISGRGIVKLKEECMEYKEKVITILKEAGKPLKVEEIIQRGIEKKLMREEENLKELIDSMILNDIKTKGIRSIFSRVGPGTYFVRNLNREHRNQHVVKKKSQKNLKSDNMLSVVRKNEKSFHVEEKDVLFKEGISQRENLKEEKIQERKVKLSEMKKSDLVAEGTAEGDTKRLIEKMGKYMGFEVIFREGDTILWEKEENPEIAFIVNPEFSSALMGKIVDLRSYNYRKIILVLKEGELESSEGLFPNEDIKTWCEIWSENLIREMGIHCEKFMSFYRKLTDFRDIGKKGVYFFK